jgi:hypothetical protein
VLERLSDLVFVGLTLLLAFSVLNGLVINLGLAVAGLELLVYLKVTTYGLT